MFLPLCLFNTKGLMLLVKWNISTLYGRVLVLESFRLNVEIWNSLLGTEKVGVPHPYTRYGPVSFVSDLIGDLYAPISSRSHKHFSICRFFTIIKLRLKTQRHLSWLENTSKGLQCFPIAVCHSLYYIICVECRWFWRWPATCRGCINFSRTDWPR